MNKRTIAFVISGFLLFSTSLLSAKEASEMWKRLYARAATLEQKYSVMQNLIEQDDGGLAPTLQAALDELIRTSSSLKTTTDRETWTQLCDLIVNGLGKMKATEAAPTLYACFLTAENPILKADALAAVGKVKGQDYAEPIMLQLKTLNLNQSTDNQSAEIVAYGCINALEKLKTPAGYKQVFYTSTGWYSQRIKERAKTALVNMLADPSDILMEIMRESIPEIKLAALQASEASQAPEAKRITMAIFALDAALTEQTQDQRKASRYGELRSMAIDILIKLKAKNDAAVDLLRQVIDKNFDVNERLNAVVALGILGSDTATKNLADLMDKQNQRQAAGIPDSDNRFTTALMRALGATKNPLGRPVLLAVEYSNYTPAMTRIAREAMQEIDRR